MLSPNMRPLLDVEASDVDEFTTAVLHGLSRPNKTLPCRYFYDARGSELFEKITRLPEYYPTRAETAILRAHAKEMAASVPDGGVLVEFGAGSSLKTELILEQLPRLGAYVPIDVSQSALADNHRQPDARAAADRCQSFGQTASAAFRPWRCRISAGQSAATAIRPLPRPPHGRRGRTRSGPWPSPRPQACPSYPSDHNYSVALLILLRPLRSPDFRNHPTPSLR
jgi:Histidine-specific methyltransferase, SAM-dependent